MPDVNDDPLTTRLIGAAARILARDGVAGLSVRKIAAAAETSTMAVYSRFGDKDGLLAAMYREGFRRLGDEQATATSGLSPMDALLAGGRAYRRAALASPHMYSLMFGPPPPGMTLEAEHATAAQATYAPLVDGVRHAVKANWLRGDVERIALHLWVVAHGMVSLELSGRLGADSASTVGAEHRYDEALLFAAAPFASSPEES